MANSNNSTFQFFHSTSSTGSQSPSLPKLPMDPYEQAPSAPDPFQADIINWDLCIAGLTEKSSLSLVAKYQKRRVLRPRPKGKEITIEIDEECKDKPTIRGSGKSRVYKCTEEGCVE